MNAASTTSSAGIKESLAFTAMAPLVLAVGPTAGAEHVVTTASVIMPTTNRASALHRISAKRHPLALTTPVPVGLTFTARGNRIIRTSREIVTVPCRAASVAITGKGKTFTLGTPTPV